MNRRSRNHRAGFTLLELVVVLAILAVLTGMAILALDGIDDDHRYDASQRLMQDIEAAVLGDERIAGFVSDMGRLPHTVEINGELTLAELWDPRELPEYDLRTSASDPEVALPSGWRGPYLKLPLGRQSLLDGWGNAMISRVDPATTGYARLLTETGEAIVLPGVEVRTIRHLGANGEANPDDAGVDRDIPVEFFGRYKAAVTAVLQFVDSDGYPSGLNIGDEVKVSVFGPDPVNPDSLIERSHAIEIEAEGSTITTIRVAEPEGAPLTIGQRAVRAYLNPPDRTANYRSAVHYLTLRPGVNFVSLVIRRPESHQPPQSDLLSR